MKFNGQVPPVVILHAVSRALSRTGSYENPIRWHVISVADFTYIQESEAVTQHDNK